MAGVPGMRGDGERFMFSVVVSKEQAEELTRLAEALGSKRSSFVRLLLEQGIERYQKILAIADALEKVG